jgi:5'-phosphate synthase pdxT subunit
MVTARVGVLALQGDFAAHAAMLRSLGVEVAEVRRVAQLAGLEGLVIPGGESTTLLNLMDDEPWFDALRRFHAGGGALLGTCAGAILLSRRVTNPAQPSLGLLDATVQRNGYGRQVDSFEARLDADRLDAALSEMHRLGTGPDGAPRLGEPLHVAFIRAPRFRAVGEGIEVLARLRGEPTLLRQGIMLAATFHAELTGDDRVHRLFTMLIVDHRLYGRAEGAVSVAT